MAAVRLFCLLLLALWVLPAAAHDPRPLYIELNETRPDVFQVQWRIPESTPANSLPALIMPASCTLGDAPAQQAQALGYRGTLSYQCPGGLSGQRLQWHYRIANPSLATLIRVQLMSGEKHTSVLQPGEESWVVPAQEAALAVAQQYSWLGVTHIWSGYDHLLFVVCLLFIARTARRIVVTITGFTLAHSLTLALQVQGVVTLPVAPVEAVIALSIVFLAHEMAVDDKASWTWRYPVAVSSSFGLLHGFGFASVLGSLGLPQTERLTALLFFNVGVEVGQLLFIAAVLLLCGRWLLRLNQQQLSGVQRMAAYLVGITASYWLVERVVAFTA